MIRTIAGVGSLVTLLLLVGYSIGYAVCLWRYELVEHKKVVDVPED